MSVEGQMRPNERERVEFRLAVTFSPYHGAWQTAPRRIRCCKMVAISKQKHQVWENRYLKTMVPTKEWWKSTWNI